MIRRYFIAAATGLLLVPASAAAQSQADQDACTPDVFKLCQDEIPNEAPIVACLKAKGADLSPACHAVMFRPDPAPASAPVAPKVRRHHPRHHRHRSIDVQ